jgi:uncharacterized membrane protein
MKKILPLLVFGLLLLSAVLVSANGDHKSEIEEGKQLIENEVSCDKLTEEQLEAMGDYYMEQMHPGEAHEIMDEMMGGEGSDSLKQMHIQMAKRLYCKEDVGGMMGGGMMNMMVGSGGMNMMGTNMMGSSFGGGSWWLLSIVGVLFWIALLIALIMLIIWLYKKVTEHTTSGSSALEILKKRFAKGELTKKQFESMKKELR